jgi:hypothetical protein
MKKLTIILLIMTFTFSLITGCSKVDMKTPSTDNNETDNTIDKETDIDKDNPAQTETEDSDNTNNTEITVDDILNAIKAAYGESYLPNMEIAPEFLEAEFGLTPDMYEGVKAEQPMIGTHADRVVIVKATEGRADDVEAALNSVRENKINDTFQYPMNLPKINATKIVRNEDFVCFLLVGAINENMDANEEESKQFAENEVDKAVNAFNDLFQ